MTTYMFLSLDQLVRSNQAKSINAFSQIMLHEFSYDISNCQTHIVKILAQDPYAQDTINAYKLGAIDTPEFRQKIVQQLDVSLSGDFDSAWNAMCEIESATAKDTANFFKLQEDMNFTPYIISTTNSLQYDYILEQFNQILDKSSRTLDDLNAVFVNSFTEHQLEKLQLALTAIERNSLDMPGNHIVSLHREIACENLNLLNATCFDGDFSSLLTCADAVQSNLSCNGYVS